MDIKFNPDDRLVGFFIGENNIWYCKFKTKEGKTYYIERQKYIDAIYNDKER